MTPARPLLSCAKFASETSTGGAERAVMEFSIDHPCRSALVNALILGFGTSYVTPAENAFRMSKSESPRFAFGFPMSAFDPVLNADPADPVSIECDQV